jgi:hypothetical protein
MAWGRIQRRVLRTNHFDAAVDACLRGLPDDANQQKRPGFR